MSDIGWTAVVIAGIILLLALGAALFNWTDDTGDLQDMGECLRWLAGRTGNMDMEVIIRSPGQMDDVLMQKYSDRIEWLSTSLGTKYDVDVIINDDKSARIVLKK